MADMVFLPDTDPLFLQEINKELRVQLQRQAQLNSDLIQMIQLHVLGKAIPPKLSESNQQIAAKLNDRLSQIELLSL